ncbi:MAG: NTP transferase domain-containing protein [Clostridiaceae bacterium]|nr:NTP transferase domain-containing protein [Clostridiaceae bacterium]
MNITKHQFEILAYIERNGGQQIFSHQASEDIHIPFRTYNRTLKEVTELGLVTENRKKEIQITKTGLEALEPYRVKRAIILAAGFGSRMIPLTFNTPKPLIRVRGKMIVESLLEAIEAAEIPEVILVRGYLWEMFDCLLHKHPKIQFVQNPIFNEANNISSAYVVKDLLRNAYVCEADLLINNQNLIRKYEYETNYLGRNTDYTDDWCFKVKGDIIRELMVGGTNCYHMYGISYWNARDGAQMADDIEATYKMPGGKERYWDEVSMRIFKKNYSIAVRPCFDGDILEIDTFNELKALDSNYDI